ncbi:MAG TPA: hypothetical protein VMD05_05235 [Candidatus Nanoarchaeia archaeon]|nr:hypothetical protein [Candidatus Nanoarchaeia archaeon]
MVSIIPSYVYSLFAALVVGTILVSACSLSMVNIKNEAENQQLNNINEYVATQSITLLNQAVENRQNTSLILDLPTQIGNQEYWVFISNDSSAAWVESGLGTTATLSRPQTTIPASVTASGLYVSSWERPILNCICQNQTIILTLTSG